MSAAADAEDWLAANDRYVAAAVAMVRDRLQVRAAAFAAPAQTPQQERWSWRPGRPGRREFAVVPATRRLDAPTPSTQGAERAEAELEALAAAMSPPPALEVLAQRLGLNSFERHLLLLCVAMELDTDVAPLCALAQGDASRRYPTFALATALFADPAWEALSPERPLRHWRLIEIALQDGLALAASPLGAAERVVSFVKGVTYLDDRLAPLLTPVPDLAAAATPSQAAAADDLLRQLGALPPDQDPPPLQLLGTDAVSKQIVAGIVCRALGRRAWRLDWSLLPSAPAELDLFARIWQRESLLLPVALYLDTDVTDTLPGPAERLISRLSGVILLGTRNLWRQTAAAVAIEVSRPTAQEQRALWISVLPNGSEGVAARLSGQFSLNAPAIRALSLRETEGEPASLADRLWDGCRAAGRPRLDALARRLTGTPGWNDIVLPAAETALLHQIADQVGNRDQVHREWGFAERMTRGLGLSVLFAGPPGTGKTLAAEVLATALRLDLFRIDLSGVVSRWLGETEANLRRLFDAAEEGGTILFIDEADALMGKRTEVKDSHDRYANIEINYLLQRMETFSGVAIMATNMKGALDHAFMRRLRFVVDFPFPGVVEREAMWRRALRALTPTEDLDFPRLARLNVTGGHIAVIALNGAFQAAQARGPVTMAMVLDAARVELRKLGRPINEAELRVTA